MRPANASCAAGLHHMLLTWAAAVGTEHVSVTATLAQTGSGAATRGAGFFTHWMLCFCTLGVERSGK